MTLVTTWGATLEGQVRKRSCQGRQKAQLEEEREDCADWGTAEVFREGRVGPQDQRLHGSQAGLTSWVRAVSAEGKKTEPEWGQLRSQWKVRDGDSVRNIGRKRGARS